MKDELSFFRGIVIAVFVGLCGWAALITLLSLIVVALW